MSNTTPRVRRAADLLLNRRPVVIGHRGFAARAPENTLPSFTLALEAGAEVVELDYHATRDGVPVVIHDETLDRTTDAVARWGGEGIRVADRTAAEIRELDAGGWFGPGTPATHVPRLEEAISLIQGRAVAMLERKGGDAAATSRVLRQGGWIERAVVHSFDWDFLRELHRKEPGLVLGGLGPPEPGEPGAVATGQEALTCALVEVIHATGARIVGWNRHVTVESVRHAHSLGMKVWVYTVNDPPLARRLLGQGVDGLISDDPLLMLRETAAWNG